MPPEASRADGSREKAAAANGANTKTTFSVKCHVSFKV